MSRRPRWSLPRLARAVLVILVILVILATLALTALPALNDLRPGILFGVLTVLVLIAYGWWSKRRGRHTPWERAEERIAPDHAVVLWKPGCVFCERLLLQLRSDPRVTWVNVWQDEDANAQVRAVNNGDELTPTVLLGEQVLRNPTAGELRGYLASPGRTADAADQGRSV